MRKLKLDQNHPQFLPFDNNFQHLGNFYNILRCFLRKDFFSVYKKYLLSEAIVILYF